MERYRPSRARTAVAFDKPVIRVLRALYLLLALQVGQAAALASELVGGL